MVNFPAPVGGTILPIDFAPSIVFAVLYGSLIPLLAFRLLNRRSRSTVLIGPEIFAIERVVVYSLRASQAKSMDRRLNPGLVTYSQLSFAVGFINVGNEVLSMLRCLLVNPTYGSATWDQSQASKTKESELGPPPEGSEDMKKTRLWLRRWFGVLALSMLTAMILGIVTNSGYKSAMKNQEQADSTWNIRIASTALALALGIVLMATCVWGMLTLPRINKKGVYIGMSVLSLFIIVASYRLSVMHQRVSSLVGNTSPLNSTKEKTLLYIFHVLPEWLIVVTLFGINSRKVFGTGPAGDYATRDKSDEDKEKARIKKEEKDKKREARTRAKEDTPSGDPSVFSYPFSR